MYQSYESRYDSSLCIQTSSEVITTLNVGIITIIIIIYDTCTVHTAQCI